MEKTQTQVLLVEDNPADVIFLREALEYDRLTAFSLTSVERLSEALALLKERSFDVALIDLGLPDSQGLETFTRLHQAHLGMPIVILSGLPDEALALQALQAGAQDYLVKGPAGFSTAARSIRYALERQQAQKALRASEERYRNLIENMTDIVMEVDAQGNYTYISPNYTSLSGYAVEKELQDSAVMHVHPDDLPLLMQKMAAAFGSERQTVSYRVKPSGDDWHWLETSAKSYLTEDGTPHLICVARDITERKKIEEALAAEKNRFDQVAATLPGAICSFRLRPDGRLSIPYASPAFEKMYGLNLAEVAENIDAITSRVPAGQVAGLIRDVSESARSLQLWRNEYQYRHPLKGDIWLEGYSMPIREADGGTTWHGVTMDISERKRVEEMLSTSERRYHALIENISDGIELIDAQGSVMYASPSAARLLGYSQAELVGPAMVQIHPDDLDRAQASMARVFTTPETVSQSYRVRHKDGGWRWIEGSATNFLDDPAIEAIVVTFRDVTERKQAENEAANRQELLEKVIQLGKNITAINDPQLCLREIHASIRQGLGFDRVGLFLFDAATSQVRGVYGTSRTGEFEENTWYAMPVTDWTDWQIALHSPNGMAFEEDFQALHHPPAGDEMYGVKQHVTLAAWAGDKPVAILTVDNLVTQRPITPADLDALQLFAGYAGLAIQNANLHAGLEQRVEERSAEAQDLYDNAPTGYHSLDANGTFVMINQTELDWLGYTREEVVGVKAFHDLITPESQQVFASTFPQLKSRGRVKELEFEMIRKDGSAFPVLLNAVAIYDATGTYLKSRSTMFDITERKKIEKALVEGEERFRLMFDRHNAVMLLVEPDSGKIINANTAAEQFYGYPIAWLKEMTINDINVLPPDEVANQRNKALRKNQNFFVFPHRLANGDVRIVEVHSSPILINGKSILFSIIHDITDRRLAENALRASEERLNFLLAKTPAIIFTTGLGESLPITFISDSVRNVFGYEPRQYLEDSGFWLSRVHPEDLQQRAPIFQNMLTSGHAIWETRVRCSDGEYRWMSTGMNLLRNEQGKPVEVIGYSVDINEEKKAQQALSISEAELRLSRDQLRSANVELEKAARMKDEFLASMSHELRSPLTGILGLSEALQYKVYGDLTAKQETALKNIESAGRHLLSLINDILDLSKIEAGQVTLQEEICSLGEICQASLQLTKGMAHKKKQNVSFSMEPAELLIIVDPRRLKQMLVNLLSNAIKFTADEGSLGLEVVRSLPEQVVRLTVWDNGIGIKTDDIPMLFQPFVQLDSSLARQNAGSGLGLVLVMRMAELHGGSVQVESVPGEGSRFTIVLPWFEPVVPPTPPVLTGRTGHLGRTATPEDIASAQGGPLVLIVDDMESLAQTSADMLQKAGFQVAVASSGQDCMKLAPIIQPDLILMDIQMPGMDGFETIRRLRTRANPRVAKVYIIALTALAMQGDRERCLEAGADDYLSKPVEFKELLTRIQGLLAKKEK